MHRTLFMPRPARKKPNVPKLKTSQELTVLIYILCLARYISPWKLRSHPHFRYLSHFFCWLSTTFSQNSLFVAIPGKTKTNHKAIHRMQQFFNVFVTCFHEFRTCESTHIFHEILRVRHFAATLTKQKLRK